MSIRTGDSAPAFALPEAPGEIVDVGAVIGSKPVVLLFFPFAFSGVCTTEMCTFRDDWSRWSELDAAVFAISVDGPFVAAKFREENAVPFAVLSDFNKEVAAQYGVLYDEILGLRGIAKRAAFVIDLDGRIAYDWVSEEAGVEPDYESVREAVKAVRA